MGLKSAQQYHHVKGVLVQMGCIGQLRRGSAYRQGAWYLLAEPTPELYATRTGPGAHRRRRNGDAGQVVPVTEVLAPDGLAGFLAKSPAERVEELRAMTSAANYLAVKALVEEASTSKNSQARVAAARTLLFLNRDVGGLEPDPLVLLSQAVEAAGNGHATPARNQLIGSATWPE